MEVEREESLAALLDEPIYAVGDVVVCDLYSGAARGSVLSTHLAQGRYTAYCESSQGGTTCCSWVYSLKIRESLYCLCSCYISGLVDE